jgi:AcrR family transcriptional regulator
VNRKLDRPAILAAALRVADRDGLGALTMRRVGDELGVEAMAIYHYFPSKSALLDELVASLYLEPPEPTESWREDLLSLSHLLRNPIRAHPAMLPELLSRPVQTENADRAREAQYTALAAAGLSGVALLDAHRTWGSYVFGYLVFEQQAVAHSAADWRPAADARFRLTASLAPHQAARDWDEQFVVGLHMLFDGFVARLPEPAVGFGETSGAEPARGAHDVGRPRGAVGGES